MSLQLSVFQQPTTVRDGRDGLTGREYVRSLRYVIDSCFPKLERADLHQDLRGKRSLLFSNWKKFYAFRCRHCPGELERCCCWHCPWAVAHGFLGHVSPLGPARAGEAHVLGLWIPASRSGGVSQTVTTVHKESPGQTLTLRVRGWSPCGEPHGAGAAAVSSPDLPTARPSPLNAKWPKATSTLSLFCAHRKPTWSPSQSSCEPTRLPFPIGPRPA